MKYMITEEVIQLLRANLENHRLGAMFLLALVTGIRRDELRRLTWSDIDLHTGKVSVLNAKMKQDVRQLSLPDDVLLVLQQYAQQQELQRDSDPVRQNAHLVFPGSTGEALTRSRFLQEWYACCECAGLPRLHFHDLRIFVGQQLFRREQRSREQQ